MSNNDELKFIKKTKYLESKVDYLEQLLSMYRYKN
jgi:hypothetical protein